MKSKKTIKKILIIFALLFLASSSFCLYSYWWYLQNSPLAAPWKFTAPLEPSTVRDICSALKLPDSDHRCDLEKDVYSPSFSRDFARMIEDGELDNKAKWDEYFGTYETYCSNAKPEFQCDYDFHGGDDFGITVVFDTNQQLVRWRTMVLED